MFVFVLLRPVVLVVLHLCSKVVRTFSCLRLVFVVVWCCVCVCVSVCVCVCVFVCVCVCVCCVVLCGAVWCRVYGKRQYEVSCLYLLFAVVLCWVRLCGVVSHV